MLLYCEFDIEMVNSHEVLTTWYHKMLYIKTSSWGACLLRPNYILLKVSTVILLQIIFELSFFLNYHNGYPLFKCVFVKNSMFSL